MNTKTDKEKAIAYDEVLGRAKSLVDFCSDNELKTLKFVFPELAESYDEKIISAIRKAIEAKVENLGNGVTRTVCLAWLEKQCEKPQGKSALDAINEENVDNQNCVKPYVKGEPKFKVGDWCIDNEDGTIFQIVKVLDNTYKYRTNEGKEYSCAHHSLELDARLWNMSDAKEGDVLVNGSNTFVFHCINDTRFMGYCHVNTDDGRFYDDIGKNECFCLIDAVVNPATKEQCDVLFAKMKESGYEWNDDKKELKKIEQKPPIVNFKARDWDVSKVDGKIYNAKFMEEPLTNQKRRLEIEKAAMSATGIIEQEEWFIKGAEWSDKNSSYISSENQGEQKSFDYENANIPQKDSTWGEKDKHWMQKVIDFMNHPDLIKATPTLAKDTINWLKSLKDRVQPQSKQEWSEEDESNFQGIIDVIKKNKHHATDYEHMTYYKLLSWFKSLKNRYVWKPSDEQMKALDWALSLAKNCGDECAFDLRTLQEQLKKI